MNIFSKLCESSFIWRLLLLLTFTTLFAESSLAQSVLSPEKIHKKVSPSVALIKDIESHGSGVVISKDGLLITNYHVVASGLPLSVTVKVKRGSKIENVTFKNLKVWKVHPKYDLALIQLPNKGVKFAVAKVQNAKQATATGATCYAIGNPGGINKALDQSITSGLVSSANREVDGLKYIQVSCALNPGNSGGAICNDKGTVIGIATWKLGQAENIGFAIPTHQIKLSDFIPIKNREVNLKLAIKYDKEGHKFANLSRKLEGKERELATRAATAYYRKSLEYSPNEPATYNNIGAMYFQLKEDEIARKYLERALEISPLYASSASMLGIIFARTDKDLEAAMSIWFKHSTDLKNIGGASDCLENISIHYINKQQFSQAAYTIKWANFLDPPKHHREATRRNVWQESSEKLTEAQFDFLKSKTESYSKEEMTSFATGKLATSKINKGNEKSPIPKMLNGILKIDNEAYTKVARAKSSKAVKIGNAGLTMPLPSEPGKIIMGYAGAYLLIEYPDLQCIGVLDICAGRMIKYISLPEEKCKFAAGGETLLIYLPEAKKFQLWDMKTWTMTAEKSWRSERTIHHFSMGLLNHNFAVISLSSANRRSHDRFGILSLPDCRLTIPKWTPANKDHDISSIFHRRDHQTRIYVEESGRYAVGAGIIDFSNEASPMIGPQTSHGIVSLGGDYLISSNGIYLKNGQFNQNDLLDKRLRKYNPYDIREGCRIARVAGFEGILHIAKRADKEGEILIRDLKTLNIVNSIYLPDYIHKMFSPARSLDMSNYQIFASAYVQHCILIQKNRRKLFIFPLKLDSIAKAGTEEIAKPGSPVSRVIDIPKGSKAIIEGEHAGASFDPNTNTLKWQIPSDFKRGTKESIILLITDADGKEKYHIEEIYVP